MSTKHHETPKGLGRSSRSQTGINSSPSPGNKKKLDDSDLVDKLSRAQLSDEEKNPSATSSGMPDDIATDRDMLRDISQRIQGLLEAVRGLCQRPTRGSSWNDVLQEMNREVREVRDHVECMEGILEEYLEASRDV